MVNLKLPNKLAFQKCEIVQDEDVIGVGFDPAEWNLLTDAERYILTAPEPPKVGHPTGQICVVLDTATWDRVSEFLLMAMEQPSKAIYEAWVHFADADLPDWLVIDRLDSSHNSASPGPHNRNAVPEDPA